jgi:ATP/maltotriose-dependent transcriptional regulator MalT
MSPGAGGRDGVKDQGERKRALDPLLLTKLHPSQARPKMVARPRLIETLMRDTGHKLTLVSAPAGFGKTTLRTSG